MIKKLAVVVCLFLFVTTLFGQASSSLYAIKAKVIDENTKEPLYYAHVFNQREGFGTACNLEGYFELPNNRLGDSVVISYLGYEDKVILVQEQNESVIPLRPNASTLSEVVVTADNDYLYAMLATLKKNKKTKTKTAKTYFYLETRLFDEPTEIIESYYNGDYKNYGLSNLSIKKGRIGLKPVNRRFFHSTESSRLFSMHDLYIQDDLFPNNPLTLGKKKMKKKFKLRLNSVYRQNGAKIYVIDFQSKSEKRDLFNGTIWVDKENNKLVKIKMGIQDATIHPFLPWPSGYNTIQRVDMNVTKTYKEIGGSYFTDAIDFDYDVVYADSINSNKEISTKAFIKAYDYQNIFTLPYFEFTRHIGLEDYRDVCVSQYDEIYWDMNREFRFYDRQQEIADFMAENHISAEGLFPMQYDNRKRQLEFPYHVWDNKRIQISQASDEIIEKSLKNRPFEKDRYNLNLKFYLDANTIQDSFIYQVYAILDPVDTYYHFVLDNSDLAFINMSFDLLEIQKREMEAELSKLNQPTTQVVQNIYQKHLDAFDEQLEQFMDDTNRGGHFRKMKEWNNYIQKTLNVDNLTIFNLSEETN